MLATRPKPASSPALGVTVERGGYPTPPSDSSASGSGPEETGTKTKKKRRMAPKTRGGCITCRRRRVKCDEGKPFCERCSRFGVGRCEGYTPATPPRDPLTRRAPSKLPVLAPRDPAETRILPVPARFKNENESRSFSFYIQEVARLIAGPIQFEDKTTLWSRLIPQACEAEPYIKQLVVSLGALGQVGRTQNSAIDRWGLRKSYEFALSEYAKALRSMRDAMTQKKHDMRHALLACLLIFCLETMQGNARNAAKHARSGLNLLHEWMSKSKKQAAGRDFIVQQQQQQLEEQQQLHNMDFYHGPEDTAESRKLFSFYGFEPDIFNAFAALDIQIWSSVSEVPGKGLAILGCLHQALLGNMPESFENLAQVRQCWLKIRSMNYHYKIHVSDAEAPLYTDRLELEPNLERMRRWFRASAKVFADLQVSGTQEEKIYMNLIKIEAYSEYTALWGSSMSTDEELLTLIPNYRTIMGLCEEVYPFLVSSKSTHPQLVDGGLFRFDVGTINPLRLVAWGCRDIPIRDRALALLNRSVYREGLYDAQATGFIAEWAKKIREQKCEVSDGLPPGNKRIVLTSMEVDADNKTISLACRSLVPGREKMRWRETLPWNFGPGRPAGVCASEE